MAQAPDLIVPARQVRVLEYARRTQPETLPQEPLLRSAVQSAINVFRAPVTSGTLPRGFIDSILAATIKKTDDLLSRKHVKTHDRILKCKILGCTSGGFYRLQDVKRHMSSCHKDVGESSKFYCPVEECKYATKGFPREDNRKRHIRVQHQGHSRDDVDK